MVFIRYRVLSWKTWSVVNVLQNSHQGQQVQVNSSLTQAGTRTLHSEHCWPRGMSTFLVLPVTQPGSSETCTQTETGKETKEDRPRDPHSGECSGKPHGFPAASPQDTKGHTSLLHARYSHGKVCPERQQSTNRSVNHGHPQWKCAPKSTSHVLRNVDLLFL